MSRWSRWMVLAGLALEETKRAKTAARQRILDRLPDIERKAMRRAFGCWMLLLVGAFLAGCGGGDPMAPEFDRSPQSVVEAIASLANEGDLDGVMEFMAQDVTYTFDGSVLDVRTDEVKGIEEVRAWFDDVIPNEFETRQEIVSVEGEIVTTEELIAWDDTRTAGGSFQVTGVYTVVDGLLLDWVLTPTDFVTHAPGEEGDVVR